MRWAGSLTLLGQPQRPPAVSAREPPAQPCRPYGCRRPDPQLWHPRTDSLRRKRAEGMTGKCALRALERRISDAIYARPIADERATRQTEPRTRKALGEQLCI